MSEPISGNALRGHLETMVLATLEKGESHGFELLQRLEAAGRGALAMKEGSLYPALYRLENGGLIKGRWDTDSQTRGPRRRVYKLTRKGQRQLETGRRQWVQFVSVIGPIVGATA